MAAVKRWYDDAEWRDLGHLPSFATTASFTVPGDLTAIYSAGRRLRLADATTLYGTVTAASYSAPDTTVSIALDSGSLSAALSAVALDAWSAESERRRFNALKTNPAQPAFLAYSSADHANATGDGTVVTVQFDAEVFDQNNDFDTDTFTAPVAGRYQFNVTVRADQISAGGATHTNGSLLLVTSNRTYSYNLGDPSSQTASEYCCALSELVDMDVGDTALVQFAIGGGTKIVDIRGSAIGTMTRFSGFLAA
jgi:hypothetical protein